ncbi:hypothetical protein LSAT2_015624, partial [Lamellibrachia satsuma]
AESAWTETDMLYQILIVLLLTSVVPIEAGSKSVLEKCHELCGDALWRCNRQHRRSCQEVRRDHEKKCSKIYARCMRGCDKSFGRQT